MRSDKFKAYKLRVAGRSYNEISRLLCIPKSTLSLWFKDIFIPEEAQARIKKRVYDRSITGLIKRNINQTKQAEKRAEIARERACSEIDNISKRDLLVIGVALYWAEGYKRPIVRGGKTRTYHPVCFTNSDPKLITLFLRFLREICQVSEDRIRANIRMFEHQNEAYVADFWQKICRIPSTNFGKIYKGISISSQRKRPHNILPYGTVQIRVSDTALYHQIMGWIDGLAIN